MRANAMYEKGIPVRRDVVGSVSVGGNVSNCAKVSTAVSGV